MKTKTANGKANDYTNVLKGTISRKQDLAKKVSPTTEMAEELCEQIEVCEEMCCPISETQIRSWSQLSVMQMLAKCRTLKFGDDFNRKPPIKSATRCRKSLARLNMI